MKWCGFRTLLVVGLAIGLRTVPAQAKQDALARAKSNYAGICKTIESDHVLASAAVLKLHGRGIDAALRERRGAGDLDAVLALNAETKRFQQTRALPSIDSVKGSDVIVGLVQKAQARRAAADADKTARLLKISRKYDAHLGKLKVTLTKKGDIEGAVKVKKEQVRLAFIVADFEAMTAAGESAAKKTSVATVATSDPTPSESTGGTVRTVRCYSCRGTGKQQKDCTTCSGQGICLRCNGVGSSMLGLSGQPKGCLTCKSSGKCKTCSGNSKVPTREACTPCEGQGVRKMAAFAQPTHVAQPVRQGMPPRLAGSQRQGMGLTVIAGPEAKDLHKLYMTARPTEINLVQFLYYSSLPKEEKLGRIYRAQVELTHVSDNGWITVKGAFNGRSSQVMFKPYNEIVYKNAKRLAPTRGDGGPVDIVLGLRTTSDRILFHIERQGRP